MNTVINLKPNIMSQFFYSRQDGEVTRTDSFNLNKVIRSVEMENGEVLVLLDDMHERSENVPDIDLKTNKMKGMKRERKVYQSEIMLTGEDIINFRNQAK
jgi:hypothetical protein